MISLIYVADVCNSVSLYGHVCMSGWVIDWVKVLCRTWYKIRHFGDVSQASLLAWYGKYLTQQMHTFTNQKKCTTTQNKHKELKSGLVTSYDIRHGKGKCLFLFWSFINLSFTYLNTYPFTYSPGTHTGSVVEWQGQSSGNEITQRCQR